MKDPVDIEMDFQYAERCGCTEAGLLGTRMLGMFLSATTNRTRLRICASVINSYLQDGEAQRDGDRDWRLYDCLHMLQGGE